MNCILLYIKHAWLLLIWIRLICCQVGVELFSLNDPNILEVFLTNSAQENTGVMHVYITSSVDVFTFKHRNKIGDCIGNYRFIVKLTQPIELSLYLNS